MSGMTMAMMGGARRTGPQILLEQDLNTFATAAGTGVLKTGTLRFNTDGTITQVETPNGGGGTMQWYSPTTASIGTSYWVRCTRQSGNALNVGTENTWQQLSANRTFGYSSTTDVMDGFFTFQLATDSGGANIVATLAGVNIVISDQA